MDPRLPAAIADFHVHLFPDRFFDAIWKRFVKDYGWEVVHRLYWRQCVDYLHEKDVSPIVFSNYAHKKGVMGPLNEFNLSVLENTTDCWCFAAFSPDDEDAISMAADILSHPRVAGIKLQLLVQRFYPHDPRLFPLYELVMEKNKRLLFHVGTGPVGNPFVGAAHFEKVLVRYPELPAVVAHMGGLEYGIFISFLDKYPNLYLDTAFSFLPGICYDQGTEALVRHRDRILYGSDFPNLIMPRELEIANLLALNLPESFYHKVFSENARRLLAEIR